LAIVMFDGTRSLCVCTCRCLFFDVIVKGISIELCTDVVVVVVKLGSMDVRWIWFSLSRWRSFNTVYRKPNRQIYIQM